MVGGDEIEVGVEVKEEGMDCGIGGTEVLTDEVIKEIKEEVDEKDSGDLRVPLLKKTIDTVMLEEFFETKTKMNEIRRVLARGVMQFAETHTEDKAKVDRLVDHSSTIPYSSLSWKLAPVFGVEQVRAI